MNQSLKTTQYGDYSFSLPTQTCIVLQFNKGKVCKRRKRELTGTTIIKQNVAATKDHIMFRHDTVYLYPSPLYSTSVDPVLFDEKRRIFYKIYDILDKSKSLNTSLFNEDMWKYLDSYNIHDRLILRYRHWKTFEMQQTFQLPLSNQKRVFLRNSDCLISVYTGAVYVPIMLPVQASTYPSINNLNKEHPFAFRKMRSNYYSWSSLSSSWVSSKIYHINCSLHYKDIGLMLNLPIMNIIKICNISNGAAKVQELICMFCPKLYIIERSKSFILSLSFSSKSGMPLNSNVGHFYISNLWKSFCGHDPIPKYVYYDYLDDTFGWKNTNFALMKCAELVIRFHLHSNFFTEQTTHKIEFQIAEFLYAEIKLYEPFLQTARSENMKVFFNYQRIREKSDHLHFYKQYRILVNTSHHLSWEDASAKCHLHNMILPTFSTRAHTRDLVAFIHHKYYFQPTAVHIGLSKFVSTCLHLVLLL